LALLAATGNFEEIPMHVRACKNTGASHDDILQAFMHVAVYAGVPKANHAIKLAKTTLAELDGEGTA
jgi:4-carboxymuconolactone decarboxylase